MKSKIDLACLASGLVLIYWPTRPLASGLVLIVGVKSEKDYAHKGSLLVGADKSYC